METFVILVVAAALSAAVVWWALPPAHVRARRRDERKRRRPADPEDQAPADGFILLPAEGTFTQDERPPAALSVLRIVIAIALVAAIWVGAVALIGLALKVQLDAYFS